MQISFSSRWITAAPLLRPTNPRTPARRLERWRRVIKRGPALVAVAPFRDPMLKPAPGGASSLGLMVASQRCDVSAGVCGEGSCDAVDTSCFWTAARSHLQEEFAARGERAVHGVGFRLRPPAPAAPHHTHPYPTLITLSVHRLPHWAQRKLQILQRNIAAPIDDRLQIGRTPGDGRPCTRPVFARGRPWLAGWWRRQCFLVPNRPRVVAVPSRAYANPMGKPGTKGFKRRDLGMMSDEFS